MESCVINFFAGPGAGKSSMAYLVAGMLKFMDVGTEIATEFAKDMVWRNDVNILQNQAYVFAKQYERLWKLKGKVKYIITDSPILLSLQYQTANEPKSFTEFVLDKFNEFNNINFFIKRVKKYNPSGRLQTEEESRNIDENVKALLENHGYKYTTIEGTIEGAHKVVELLKYDDIN